MKLLYGAGYILCVVGFIQIYNWPTQEFYQFLSTALMIAGAVFISTGHGVEYLVKKINRGHENGTDNE